MTIRLYSFHAGEVHTRGVRFHNRDGGEELRDMADPNHCYLIQHPQGLLMFDAGLPDSIASLPGQALVRGKFRFLLRHSLSSLLAQAGFHSEDVRLLTFSHLQIDHAGNTGLFSNATPLLQRAEYDMAFGPEAVKWGYHIADYACLQQRLSTLLDGDHDVFGDGRVILLSAPGHTPGHQVLYVELEQSGPVLLSGDLYYAPGDPALGWMPAWNYDAAQTRETMARLEAFAARHGARWIINHTGGEEFYEYH